MSFTKQLGALRAAIGVGAWAAPDTTGKLFGLDPVGNPQASYLARLFGVRDIALAAGTLGTDGASRKLWLQLGIACDVADAAAGVLARRKGVLPAWSAVLVTATAVGAAVTGVLALREE
ncbi:MAG: hypothetical protein JWN32_4329 [Solirubrobacterales bacterium]|jgi:hypothetical protein|nr:hypothetical protein [Solirubrobacterales bacterium]